MKILIVDDENEKASKIKEIITEHIDIDEKSINIVPSINDAVAKLLIEKYDLMITDMCIFDFYGGKLCEDGGLQLIKILSNDKRIIAPNEIIALTAHEDLAIKYREQIGKESFDIVTYNDSSDQWKDKIVDKIVYLRRLECSPSEVRSFKYDLAILTAVPCEKEAVEKLSTSWTRVYVDNDSAVYHECVWRENEKEIKVVTTSLMQMGMVSAATITMKLVYNFTPHYIIMPGIAGGVKEEYNIGDIIIPREVKDYCSGKYTTPKNKKDTILARQNPLKFFQPTAYSIHTNSDIINIFANSFSSVLREIHEKSEDNKEYSIPSIRNGNMASGDSVVQNNAVIDMMITNHLRNADGLDMEAYGMYYASQQALYPKPIPICMKAISDFANKKKNDKHQAYAACVSAEFMKYFVVNELDI
jgi:nucleoside phosphorylase/CheY-like chemotaxis protein